MQSLEKAVELLAAGKRQPIEEFRKAVDLFVAWKKQYPKEADNKQGEFRKALDLWSALNKRLLDDLKIAST